MNVVLTPEDRRALKRLLKLGRWGNESEIMRYGLHLVKREVAAELEQDWPQPIPRAVLEKWYTEDEPEADRELESRIAKGMKRYSSAAPEPPGR